MTNDFDTNQSGNVFTRFVASPTGRFARVALGTSIIGTGLFLVPAPAGLVLAAAGVLPVATGMLNLCPIAPAWGGHFNGARYCPSRQPRR